MTVAFRSIFEVSREEWLAGLKLDEADIPDAVILEGSWWRKERQMSRLGCLSDVRELGFPDIYWGRWNDKKIVFCMAYGAPRAVEVSQIFSKIGCKLVIQIGTCGGLQKHLKPGDIIIPDIIWCQDGVAEHYVTGKAVKASPHWARKSHQFLKSADRNCYSGQHVTFSALFAETADMCQSWHDAGLLSVDMEAATTLAAAAKYGVPGVAILVVWDEIIAGRRFLDPMADSDLLELRTSNEAVFSAALNLVENLP